MAEHPKLQDQAQVQILSAVSGKVWPSNASFSSSGKWNKQAQTHRLCEGSRREAPSGTMTLYRCILASGEVQGDTHGMRKCLKDKYCSVWGPKSP